MQRVVGFHFPYLSGGRFEPGAQPLNPGEPTAKWGGHEGLRLVPHVWPAPVPVLNVLSSHPGTPRGRAVVPVVDGYATAMGDSLFIGGVVGKSKG